MMRIPRLGSERQQVVVAGDDALGLGAFGAFENRFVLGIAADAGNGVNGGGVGYHFGGTSGDHGANPR